ncbi:MAG: hypothetical protein ABFD04_10510 [Syntrophomonas sp.]
MRNYSLNQKVILRTYGNEYEEVGIIVAIMGFSNLDMEHNENDTVRLKLRIGNMITDWIPESVIKGLHKLAG